MFIKIDDRVLNTNQILQAKMVASKSGNMVLLKILQEGEIRLNAEQGKKFKTALFFDGDWARTDNSLYNPEHIISIEPDAEGNDKWIVKFKDGQREIISHDEYQSLMRGIGLKAITI